MRHIPKTQKYDCGVLIGRFQCSDLHEGHLSLIQSVIDNHEKVIIILGLTPLVSATRNPLDFEMRKQMILSHFPDVNVLYIKDQPSDELWSHRLDEQVTDIVSPTQSVALYGSRDSFIKFYHGKYPTVELESDIIYSASEERKRIGKKVKNSPEFRAGVIWATQNKYATVYTTVDIAIIDHENKRLLLGRKNGEELYRFVGGFATPDSLSFEADAAREVQEETGLICDDYKYVGSFQIDDWRYRFETDSIKTILFTAKYTTGRAVASDDIAEVRWFNLEEITNEMVMPEHRVLYDALKEEVQIFETEFDINLVGKKTIALKSNKKGAKK